MKYFVGLILAALLVAPQVGAQTPSTAEQELIKTENDWSQAVIKRDTAALQRLYAPEFLSIDQEGLIWNKAQDIANITAGTYKLQSYKLEDVKVRVFGDVGIVTGVNTIKGTLHDHPLTSQFRFTDVFVKRGGAWQVVTSQGTSVSDHLQPRDPQNTRK